jgi:hypothetical protein
MKTIKKISLTKFNEELGELAKKVNETYYHTSVTLTHSNFHSEKLEHVFSCYMNPSRLTSGKTAQQALDKMKELLFPMEPPDQEVFVFVDKPLDEPEKLER